jgi:acyl carrier protein
MIPDVWVHLETMPLTPNGKIHKDSLRIPEDQVKRGEMHLPENPVEEKVYEIWKETLGVEQIDVEDNFFEVGGTSLSLAIMFSKLNRQFGEILNIADAFAHPSIRKMSAYILSKTDKQQRILLDGMILKKECYSKGTASEYCLNIPHKPHKELKEFLFAGMSYVLGRISQEKQISFYFYEENCCFSTVSCDIMDGSSIKEMTRNLKQDEQLWHIDNGVRRPGNKKSFIALRIGEKALTRKEEDKLLSLFDLWVDVRTPRDAVELQLYNVGRTISDGVCKTILKVIASFIEKFST